MPKQSSPALLADTKNSASIFAALGDETRLRLVFRLSGSGPMSITTLAAGSKVTRQAITKHLHVMEQAGLVHSTRQGRERVWQLKERGLVDARRSLDVISKQWDSALERLRRFVED